MNDQKICKYSTTRVADQECSDCRAGLCSVGSCGYKDEDNKYYCNECWAERQENETGECFYCETPLEAIWENNGFTEPEGPSKWEISEYQNCSNCGEGGGH